MVICVGQVRKQAIKMQVKPWGFEPGDPHLEPGVHLEPEMVSGPTAGDYRGARKESNSSQGYHQDKHPWSQPGTLEELCTKVLDMSL